MTKTLLYIGIAVLAVIAVVLGYKIWEQLQIPPIQRTQDTSVPQTVGNQQTSQQTTQSPSIPQSDWDRIVNFDSTKEDEEANIDFTDTVVKYAKESNIIEFNQCKASPLIVTMKIGSEFTIRSTDSKEQSIAFGSKQYLLKPGDSLQVKEDFAQVPGIYRYACSYGSGNTGTYIPVAGVLRV